jgi:hypothetical protein
MAISVASPTVPDDRPAPDLVSLSEASTLLEDTGHPVRCRTLKRWLVRHDVTVVERRGLEDRASWSDILVVHAAEVDRRGARG